MCFREQQPEHTDVDPQFPLFPRLGAPSPSNPTRIGKEGFNATDGPGEPAPSHQLHKPPPRVLNATPAFWRSGLAVLLLDSINRHSAFPRHRPDGLSLACHLALSTVSTVRHTVNTVPTFTQPPPHSSTSMVYPYRPVGSVQTLPSPSAHPSIRQRFSPLTFIAFSYNATLSVSSFSNSLRSRAFGEMIFTRPISPRSNCSNFLCGERVDASELEAPTRPHILPKPSRSDL